MLGGSAVLALAGAGVWTAWQGGEYRRAAAIALVVLAGIISFTGGTVASRGMTSETYAFLGWGPGREEPATGDALTAVGVFLFVAVPLFLVGGFLYGTG
jgi:hypothetical protein